MVDYEVSLECNSAPFSPIKISSNHKKERIKIVIPFLSSDWDFKITLPFISNAWISSISINCLILRFPSNLHNWHQTPLHSNNQTQSTRSQYFSQGIWSSTKYNEPFLTHPYRRAPPRRTQGHFQRYQKDLPPLFSRERELQNIGQWKD